jgi:uncharacterized protein YqcC (DUF446 family)
MHDIPQRLAGVLFEIEAVLRSSGKWEAAPPSAAALSSLQPFCLDTLSLEQWLQWIMLPRMKDILEHQQPLPRNSAIAAYAEECLHASDPQVLELLALIRRFDELIRIQAGRRTH